MASFRKRPVVVEAVRWTGDEIEGGAPWWITAALRVSCGDTGSIVRSHDIVVIHAAEGTMRADPGDWIIRGVDGGLYPCRPDVFEATYEPAGVSA